MVREAAAPRQEPRLRLVPQARLRTAVAAPLPLRLVQVPAVQVPPEQVAPVQVPPKPGVRVVPVGPVRAA